MSLIVPERTCGCLCQVNHPDLPQICSDEPNDSVKFVNPKQGIDEPVEIPMCHPCAEATRIRRVKR